VNFPSSEKVQSTNTTSSVSGSCGVRAVGFSSDEAFLTGGGKQEELIRQLSEKVPSRLDKTKGLETGTAPSSNQLDGHPSSHRIDQESGNL
jgi:hypothetical protein